jgi:hypothetical protein
LGPESTDPSVRHSAICQLAAMLQETRLHSAFLEAGGLDICVEMFDDALVCCYFSPFFYVECKLL